MKVSVEVDDYSNPAKPSIRVHNAYADRDKVEIEVDGVRHIVMGVELISAIERCLRCEYPY